MRSLRAAAFLLLCGAAAAAAQPDEWLNKVAPIMAPAEKRAYLALSAEAKEPFQRNFWNEKAISADEYFRRLEYIDSHFGSTKAGSGAHTDPGRVYLALGAPHKITRIPSSRLFSPLEIWYYNTVPGVLDTELHLIFYQKNSLGLPRLYSPTLDTVRALLLPQSSTLHMFGPNDDLTENALRANLNVGPAEDEVVSAAVNIAAGVKNSGNDQLLARISSPALMLRKPLRTDVQSQLVFARPPLEIVQSNSPFGARQVDFALTTNAGKEIGLQLMDGAMTLYRNQVHLKFETPAAIRYAHRLDLLPGVYTAIFSVDGKAFPYSLTVQPQSAMSELIRGKVGMADGTRSAKPWQFGASSFEPAADGGTFLVSLPSPAKTNWVLRKGMAVVAKSFSEASDCAFFDLPAPLEPGAYELEASSDAGSRSVAFVVGETTVADKPTLLSFNANLQPALRWSFIGRQWLWRANLPEARGALEKSLAQGVTKDAMVELARAEALAGQWDQARGRLRKVLAVEPDDFDSLSVLAYIEAQLQDFQVAAQLYKRALAIQDSSALRAALANLPQPAAR